ncbi:hypothetical protein ABT336_14095 [Micromonospora sp. NPDC000207]|uniref:hypothetical protein n=1 Tax=Micromonospora sp. NPDC000207 TaxID=3154246 RepID=UPI00331C90F5
MAGDVSPDDEVEQNFDVNVERLALRVLAHDIGVLDQDRVWSARSAEMKAAVTFVKETRKWIFPDQGRPDTAVKKWVNEFRSKPADLNLYWARTDPPPYGGTSEPNQAVDRLSFDPPYGMSEPQSPIVGLDLNVENDLRIRIAVARKISDWLSASKDLRNLHESGSLEQVSAIYRGHPERQFGPGIQSGPSGGSKPERGPGPVFDARGELNPTLRELASEDLSSFDYRYYARVVESRNSTSFAQVGRWGAERVEYPIEAYLAQGNRVPGPVSSASSTRPTKPTEFRVDQAASSFRPTGPSMNPSSDRGSQRPELGSNNPYRQSRAQGAGAPYDRPGAGRSR